MTAKAVIFFVICCGGIWGSLAWAMVHMLKFHKRTKTEEE